ncbi:MAG: 5-(carboxyamino)imidazole ribonucleotide synthase [Saprospiraceae bacterium]
MTDQKIGILGGGQLGKMLCQEASKLGIRLNVLEKDDSFPAAAICPDVTYGDFKNKEDVLNFGSKMDIVTVEIEAVNTEALYMLEKSGIKVYPQPHILDLIKDKGLQKTWYVENNIPTSYFQLFENAQEVIDAVNNNTWQYPFVQKIRTDGYDGQGVRIIKSKADLKSLLNRPCLLEQLVDIDKEISVIVAQNPAGEIKSFPLVEMEFHPTANLVEYLFSPSSLSQKDQKNATLLAESIAKKMGIIGLLAVELFLTKGGNIIINEVAPRPHNSGHQTIEGNLTSQYAQHLRAIMNLPLGDTQATSPSVMVNILGEVGHQGKAKYNGIKAALNISGANIHIYGKEMTKPFRKMGHATIIAQDLDTAKNKAKKLKSVLKVTT